MYVEYVCLSYVKFDKLKLKYLVKQWFYDINRLMLAYSKFPDGSITVFRIVCFHWNEVACRDRCRRNAQMFQQKTFINLVTTDVQ